jgi:hypothetical protein
MDWSSAFSVNNFATKSGVSAFFLHSGGCSVAPESANFTWLPGSSANFLNRALGSPRVHIIRVGATTAAASAGRAAHKENKTSAESEPRGIEFLQLEKQQPADT